MRKLRFFVFFFLFAAANGDAQRRRTDVWGSAREVVQAYWDMGVTGELLTSKGWDRAAAFFAQPTVQPSDKSFRVFSNYYGIEDIPKEEGKKSEIGMYFDDAGRVDGDLR